MKFPRNFAPLTKPMSWRPIIQIKILTHKAQQMAMPITQPTKLSDEELRSSSPDRRQSELLKIGGDSITGAAKLKPILTKLLVKVTIERCLGPVQVVMLPENTVRDLIRSTVEIYVKEKRRPLLAVNDPDCFQLHYSQFNLECLKQEEKLVNLGSRNFFLCSKASNSSYNEGIEISNKASSSWTKLKTLLL